MRFPVGALALLLLWSCVTPGSVSWTKGSTWALVRVDLEEDRLAQKGSLPVFAPPTPDQFGRAPMAEGSLGVSKDGRVVCRVIFIEPAPRSSYRYPVVRFDGMFGERPERIDLLRPAPENVAQGTTTVLHVREISGSRLRVQGATGETLLPYVYYFAPPPARVRPVPLPTR